MKPSFFTSALRTLAIIAIASLSLSCDLKEIKVPKTGRYYDTVIEGRHYFTFIESITEGSTHPIASTGKHIDPTDASSAASIATPLSENDADSFTIKSAIANATGFYYSADTDSTVTRHDFTAKLTHRKFTITSDSGTHKIDRSKIKYSRYSVPEFSEADTTLFREKCFDVKCTKDIRYASAKGYWASLPGVEQEVSKAFTQGYVKSFKHKDIDLTLDLYQPERKETSAPWDAKHVAAQKHPLILFIHGGAFYVGDKQEPAYIDFCRHFAGLGYVTASMNYRMGFHVGKGEIQRAGYTALQDAHAAMRFLVAHADEYGIDTGQIFVAGSSAGSITAMNLAFMGEKDRLKSSHGAKGLFNGYDLGAIATSGNNLKADFHIKAVANMWGAMFSTDLLNNSHTDIISFHGDADNVMPYGTGYPFSSAGKAISQMLSDEMYGSTTIHKAALDKGLRSEMYSFKGEGHALNTTGKEKKPNGNHKFIKERMKDFFYREIVPVDPAIICDGSGHYHIDGTSGPVLWKVEGGFLVSDGQDGINILWMNDAPKHNIAASGYLEGGAGFVSRLSI